MAKPQAVTDADFTEEVLNSDLPVLVDFWADWCGPCKMVAPIVEELANDYDGKLKVMKVDVDSSPLTAGTYGIRSIPTLLIFKDGKPVQQVVGAVPKQMLQEKIDQVV
ncbi:MAG: thioredoxin [Chloroflexi bacterium]|nr:thioredoxin [Chloroflexota bacterium]